MEESQNYSENIERRTGRARNQVTTENCRIGWVLYTSFGKNDCESTEHSTLEITLRIPQSETTEKLQRCMLYKYTDVRYKIVNNLHKSDK
jgi:hypothetical protein